MPIDKTVVVAMSGGVDSSVAALLLKEQGYNCIGITMKLWDYQTIGGRINHESGCCSLDSINDARMVCAKLDIPHYVVNFSQSFHKEVVSDFIDEYVAGRTPNPCVLCNTKIKWESLIEKALDLGADYIATGHYSAIEFNPETGRYELSKAKDDHKDQSYALWGIRQESLARTLFPLSGLTKPEIREIAAKNDLRTAHKSESMEICFVPDNNYKKFLTTIVDGLEEEVSNGQLVTTDGNVVGQHPGYPFFTIGQRRGIGKGFGKPMYVVDTDPKQNRVVIGEAHELLACEFEAKNVNMVSIARADQGLKASVKIRYNDKGHPATFYTLENDRMRVVFDEPQSAITPGQSAVCYDGDKVLAGGVIDTVKRYHPKSAEDEEKNVA